MNLSGDQYKKLKKALINAFPDKSRLKQMLSLELEKNLDEIAGGVNLSDIVFNLIDAAKAENWIEDLIKAARKSNSGNQLLKDIAEELLENHEPKASSASSHNTQTIKNTRQLRILILAAIPHGLGLDKEIREIENAIRRATRRDLFDISIRTAVRPKDIRRAIAEEQPQIVHFCGHGLKDGSLQLEDENRNSKPASPSGLATLFEKHSSYVECVILNACYSVVAAEAISQYIDYVIGMNQEIGDKAAIAFTEGFYDGLGFEQEDNQDMYQTAFNEGLVAIGLEDFSQKSIPVLKKNVNDIIKPNNTAIKWLEDIPTIGYEASEVGADYTRLFEMLSKRDFKAADKETTRMMLWVTGREKKGFLRKEHIKQFPCHDLRTIDQLWLASSDGKFGFSAQKQIWIECGKKVDKFYRQLGWTGAQDTWVNYDKMFWDLRGRKGHFPFDCYHMWHRTRIADKDIRTITALSLMSTSIGFMLSSLFILETFCYSVITGEFCTNSSNSVTETYFINFLLYVFFGFFFCEVYLPKPLPYEVRSWNEAVITRIIECT